MPLRARSVTICQVAQTVCPPCRICNHPGHLRCGHDGSTEQLVLGKPLRNLPSPYSKWCWSAGTAEWESCHWRGAGRWGRWNSGSPAICCAPSRARLHHPSQDELQAWATLPPRSLQGTGRLAVPAAGRSVCGPLRRSLRCSAEVSVAGLPHPPSSRQGQWGVAAGPRRQPTRPEAAPG